MRNLNYINCVEIAEYDMIVQSKHEPNRTLLKGLRSSIDGNFNKYLNQFTTIKSMPKSVYSDLQSTALQGCYGVKTAARDDLIKRIIDEQTVEFKEVCGYCQYYLRSTIDHYIPQEEYSEFSVLPKNLVPCCSTCNTIKNRYWRENGNRLFLHLYNDIIPNERFVFGELTFNNNNPVIAFRISNDNVTIDTAFYNIIRTHFQRLGLCNLYSKGVAKIISDIKVDVRAIQKSLSVPLGMADYQNLLLNKSVAWKQLYGINYWRAISYDILANSNAFLQTL